MCARKLYPILLGSRQEAGRSVGGITGRMRGFPTVQSRILGTGDQRRRVCKEGGRGAGTPFEVLVQLFIF